MRKIFFDIETSNDFRSVGNNNPADLDISVVGIYDSENDSYTAFLQSDFQKLWLVFEHADLLITFNGEHFDVPLLNKYYPGDLTKIKHVDLLKEMQKSAGRRMKLDQIAEGTLGIRKSGNGIEALRLWKEGKVEEVKKYCLDDVRITKELYEYALANGKLTFKEGSHMYEIKLGTRDWETPNSSALTHTLPF